jgi:pimeloyl-ACP methyl ester carboxylesterase
MELLSRDSDSDVVEKIWFIFQSLILIATGFVAKRGLMINIAFRCGSKMISVVSNWFNLTKKSPWHSGKLALWFLLLSPITTLNLRAQDIVGQWQGTIPSTPPLRAVLRVVRNEGTLRGYIISVDQSPDYFPVTSISDSNGEVMFSIADFQVAFDGKMSNDGNEITGTWTQGESLKLDLHRATPDTSWLTKSTIFMIEVAPNVSLEVIDWGGSGPPLVFLAGLGNTAHVFDKFALKFVPAHHVYGITRRGFGMSSSPVPDATNYRADQLGDDVVKVIDALGLKKPVLVGHSIAGEELSSIGSRYPEKIAGLIYLDAGYPYALYSPDAGDTQLDAEDVQKQLNTYLASRPGATDQRKLIADLLAELPQLQKDLEVDDKRNNILPPPPPGKADPEPPFAAAANAIVKGETKYTDIEIPLLAIFASPHDPSNLPQLAADKKAEFIALDQARSAAQAKAFQKLKFAKVVVLPNANHFVFFSNEQDVEKAMKDFLNTLAPEKR